MKEMQNIKKLVIALLKGLPIIITTFLVSLFIAHKTIQYSTPKYQSMAKIKLDDRKYGMSGNNLYEDFDVFSSENKIETEAEILKSPLLIGKAIKKLNLSVMVTRQGIFKNTTLLQDNPFLFSFDSSATALMNTKFILNVDQNNFTISDENNKLITSSSFGSQFSIYGETLQIDIAQKNLLKKDINTNGNFEFEIKSHDQWINYASKLLDVKAIDKEIPVLRVVVNSENANFSSEFANTLCQVYIEDYIYTKSIAASKTLGFINDRMDVLKNDLESSENDLELYKKNNDVVNTLQETETGLRGMSKLQLQLINIEMEEKAIIELESYISKGDFYDQTAVNFGFGDLVLTELVKKLKLYSDQKKDLELKYTENDQRIINVNDKISDIQEYIKKAVEQNKYTIETKREEIEKELLVMSSQFDGIPTREKEMRILEREFQINESVYTFLAQKKLEAQIATSALMSFHRIIQPAVPALKPNSPNKTLIIFVCGFLGLFIGITIVYGRKIVGGKVQNRSDIEKLTSTQILGVLTNIKNNSSKTKEFITLAKSIDIHLNSIENKTILITSGTRAEGKSFISENLAEIYSKMGFSVALIDINFCNPSFEGKYDIFLEDMMNGSQTNQKSIGVQKIGIRNQSNMGSLVLSHREMPQTMAKIQSQFDIVIIDTPGSVISIDGLSMLKYADICLYSIRTNVSKAQYVENIDTIKNEFEFKEMKIILNGAHKSTNYSGNFNGSSLHYTEKPTGLFNRIKHYLNVYAK